MVSDFQPQESYQFFMQEALELLQQLEQGLLELRENQNISKIHELMRITHSLKGGSACVGLDDIQQLAHGLENIFKTLHERQIAIDSELEELLLQAYDCLHLPLVEQIETGHHDRETSLVQLATISSQIEAKLTTQQDAILVVELEKKKNVIDFILTEEVNCGFHRLEEILQHPIEAEMIVALKIQIEIFRGLGELSHIPSFVAIAQTALQALKSHPESAQIIAKKALQDFRDVQVTLLTGNPNLEKKPSVTFVKVTPPPMAFPVEEMAEESIFKTPFNLTSPSEGFSVEEIAEEPTFKTPFNLISPSEDFSVEEIAEEPELNIPLNLAQLGLEFNLKDIENQSQSSLSFPSTVSSAIVEPVENFKSSALGIRIDINRLEQINHLIEDLVTQDNRFLLQNQQYAETIEFLDNWFNRFEKLMQTLTRSINQLSQEKDRIEDELTRISKDKNISLSLKLHQKSVNNSQTNLQTFTEELAQLGEVVEDLTFLQQGYQNILKNRQKNLHQLQRNLIQARMLPIEKLLNQFPRMIRDLANKEKKQVKLELKGTETLVDKAILDKIYDPLVHLVRNAFDHGIESPQIRKSQGKSPEGKITISTYHKGNQTYIIIQDDGQGIDWQKIRTSAIAMNLLSPDEATIISENSLAEYLFTPALSTKTEVSHLSGRGMGLSSVKLQIHALKGTVKVTSLKGKGTQFVLQLPLTLTIIKLLVVQINGYLLAIPMDDLVSIKVVDKSEIETKKNQKFYGDGVSKILIYPLFKESNYEELIFSESNKITLIFLGNEQQKVAIKIDKIIMEENLVLKPFNEAINPPNYLHGCTILGDGRLVPVLAPSALVETWLENKKPEVKHIPIISSIQASPVSQILVIDDSLTIRKTLCFSLQKAGYQVIEAKDGWEAIAQIQRYTNISAVICDIEMPRMNGLEFLTRARQLKNKSLPIIILTSRSSEKYRQLAQQLGATSYLTKPYVEKNLLNLLKTEINRYESEQI